MIRVLDVRETKNECDLEKLSDSSELQPQPWGGGGGKLQNFGDLYF